MNNKKITIIFILVSFAILVGIGITFAYFTSSTDFENEFQTGLYQTEATETFTSPQNWLPGDTTPKTLIIKNTGNVDVKARVCISEEWESANGDTLPNEQNGERVAILNLANTSDWTQRGNCFYYNDTLEPDDETSSFIESVTFNPNIEADITCTTSGNTKTCTSSGNGYDNATYTLTFRIDTIQANKAEEVWASSSIVYAFESTAKIGYELPSSMDVYDTKEEAISANGGTPIYFKFKIEYGVVTEGYLGFNIINEMVQNQPGMLVGNYEIRSGGATYDAQNNSYNNDSLYYFPNKVTIADAFSNSYCDDTQTNNYICSYNKQTYYTEFYVNVSENGYINIGYDPYIIIIDSEGNSSLQYYD